MAVRDDFSAGEVLAAADLNDTFAAKLDYPSGGANGDALIKDGASAVWGSAGRIVQVVQDSDGSVRSTTSTSFVDVPLLSVDIAPVFSDSAIYVFATGWVRVDSTTSGSPEGKYQITDGSNNAIPRAEDVRFGIIAQPRSSDSLLRNQVGMSLIGRDTPATTGTVTYKLRFASNIAGTTNNLLGNTVTSQIIAMEVRI